MSERPQDPTESRDPEAGEVDPAATDPAPAAPADDPMGHRFAADEEVAEGASGADEARTPGMGG